MANPAKDMTGLVFGYLTVIRRHTQTPSGRATWLCRCVCGNEVVRIGTNLRSTYRGPKKSCGCRRGEMLTEAWGTHGMTNHPAYHTWAGLRQRCLNPKSKDWKNYGGRGVTVCDRWLLSFENFWADMGPSWFIGASIDRTDNAKGYFPENCRWTTARQQSNNKRPNIIVSTPRGRMTAAQAADLFGLKRITLYKRLEKGWDHLRAVTTPPRSKNRHSTSLTRGRETGLSYAQPGEESLS